MKFLIASNNQNKKNEFERILSPLGIEVVCAEDIGIKLDGVDETGNTFLENALLKARSALKLAEIPVIADDSGLEVDYLGGAPGIYSARYSGSEANDAKNIKKLLKELEGVPKEKRSANFCCVICCLFPNGDTINSTGRCDGYIGFEPKGKNGFGYDPVFIAGSGKTFAQMSDDEKDQISHRGNALRSFSKMLSEKIKEMK